MVNIDLRSGPRKAEFINLRVCDRTGLAFTLIELLVVLSIVALLLTLVTPRYFQRIDVAKEVALKSNLQIMRETIDKFYGDTGRYPNSLEELVEKRYLRNVPIDPMTESSGAWIIVPPDDASKGAVYNVKSAAGGVSRDGVAFSSY